MTAFAYVLIVYFATATSIYHKATPFKTEAECIEKLADATKGLPIQSGAFCAPIPDGKPV